MVELPCLATRVIREHLTAMLRIHWIVLVWVAFIAIIFTMLCGCQTTSETVTTTTAPDGNVTQTVTRPLSDPFDIALSEAARELFKEGAE